MMEHTAASDEVHLQGIFSLKKKKKDIDKVGCPWREQLNSRVWNERDFLL